MDRSRRGQSGAVPLGDVIQELIRTTEAERQAPLLRARTAWGRVVDGPTAHDSRVSAYRNGVVTVEVKSPPLCAELAQFRARRLTERMRKELGDDVPLKRLRFKHGAW